MKRVVLFPSEKAIIVSLVKYPAIVEKRTTVIDEKSGKKMEKCLPPVRRCLKSWRHFEMTWKKGRKKAYAVELTRGCDWLVRKKMLK